MSDSSLLNILVVGSGGREHALLQACLQSPLANKVIAAPGNGGMALEAVCFDVPVEEIEGMVALALAQGIGLVVAELLRLQERVCLAAEIGPQIGVLTVRERRARDHLGGLVDDAVRSKARRANAFSRLGFCALENLIDGAALFGHARNQRFEICLFLHAVEVDQHSGQQGLHAVHLIDLEAHEPERGAALCAFMQVDPDVPGVFQLLGQHVVVELGRELGNCRGLPLQLGLFGGDGHVVQLRLSILAAEEGQAHGAELEFFLELLVKPRREALGFSDGIDRWGRLGLGGRFSRRRRLRAGAESEEEDKGIEQAVHGESPVRINRRRRRWRSCLRP